MISNISIYEALKQIIPSDLPVKLGYIELSKVKEGYTYNTIDTLLINIAAANNPKYDLKGNITIEKVRVNFNLYTHKGEDGVLFGDNYCKRICDSLDSVYNKKVKVIDDNFLIMYTLRLGRPVYTGPTKQGINTFSINYILTYSGQ